MKNELTYLRTTYDTDAIRSIVANMDTSLNERSLDVDTLTAVVDVSKAATWGRFLTADGEPVLTADGENLMVRMPAPSPDSMPQDEPVRFLRGGSQHSLWFRDEIRRIGPNLWQMILMSSLGRLSQMSHKGGIYTGELAGDVIDEICGVVPHFVDATFASVPLYGWLPYVSPSGENGAATGSAKDNLLQVLFALNCTVRDDAQGVLRIENLSTGVTGRIDADRIYRDNASVEYGTPVTDVTVLEHQYITGAEPETLFEGTTAEGQIIVFREPVSNLQATGFTVTESGANYCVVSAGTGTLTGVPYVHITREITRAVTAAAVPNGVRIEDATLVGITASADVADRLADYYAHRTRIKVNAIVQQEDAGDVVEILDPFDKVMRSATLESIYSLHASGIMMGSLTALVGYLPWQVRPFVDRTVVLTGSGTWTPPAGVTQVTAVLIGGGDGGSKGEDGGLAPTPQQVSDSQTTTGYVYMTWGFSVGSLGCAEGGAPGSPGQGGNFLLVDISLDGTPISYACGTGGTGEVRNGAAATRGTDTTFGPYSSASGARSAQGYEDPVDGNVYAAVGEAGYKGGDGGGYKKIDDVYQAVPGGDVGEWTGGQKNPFSGYSDRGSASSGRGHFEAYFGGGFGGGAAYGSDGNDGLADGYAEWLNSPPTYGRVYACTGGAGASASAPSRAANYGQGGPGGNGGGGAGQNGAPTYIQNSRQSSVQAPSACYIRRAGIAVPGNGSDGGDGADGCIVLHFREPVA